METPLRRFPIGLQNFEQIRRDNRVYIDKTDLIYQMTHTDTIYFLSRPRRFGKSLLVSTLEAYFQGKKELFKGLAMERLETEWIAYPVLHMDFSASTYTDAGKLRAVINVELSRWEERYEIEKSDEPFSLRFERIIQRAYEKTGKQVVVLVDEYDSPLLDTNSNRELQSELRAIVRDFYSPLKKNAQYLRFLFLTGISKFSQLSIFSELNNLQNISTDDRFGSICGITEEELLTELKPYIERMAQKNGETYEETCANLKKKYDGYHFSGNCPDIYNPFSLLSALNSMAYKNYWFSTGTPTFLLDLLKRAQFDVRRMDNLDAMEEQFDAPTETITDPIPVLYQAGYLTIKEYNPRYHNYVLGYPNEEVRYSFTSALLPRYVHLFPRDNTFYIIKFITDLENGDLESCLERTRAFFASIPNDLENKTEKHYQTIFYLLYRLMGQFIETEVKTAIGRADVVIKTVDTIYVFEFKFDGTPEEALAQINSKQYTIPYQMDGRRVVKIGLNFDSETRTIGGWKIEE